MSTGDEHRHHLVVPGPAAVTPGPLSWPVSGAGPSGPGVPPPRFGTGGAVIAWVVIVGAVVFVPLRQWWTREASTAALESLDLVAMRLQARTLVGLAGLGLSGSEVYPQARALERGGFGQRLRFAVLAGELAGPAEARAVLRRLREFEQKGKVEPSPDEAGLLDLLDHLYTGYVEDRAAKRPLRVRLPEKDRERLRRQLGWFGDLALAPPGSADEAAREAVLAPARRATVGLLIWGCVLGPLALGGLFLLVVLGVFWIAGRLRGLAPGSGHGGVYAETFALYMVSFLALGYGLSWLLSKEPWWLPGGESRLLLSGLVALASLAALAWPVLRGVPWRQVREDVGWWAGRRPFLEPFLGLACYASALPLLFVGVLLTLGLTALRDRLGWGPDPFGPSGQPSHPIMGVAGQGGWWLWVQVLFVAAVVAPVVEETMFRGALYRHLREATAWCRPALSVLASAVVVSFLFAVIHPQGLLGVPPLMALAFTFALFREWRNSLVSPMVAHGINNAMATLLLWVWRVKG